MINNNFQEIIICHKNKGMIEEATGVTIIDDNLVKFNKYTLHISKIKASKIDVNYYNASLIKQIRKNANFYKEIREFTQLFRFFDKLNIQNGYIKKTESPDFELVRNGINYGIEITRIYTGNDWVAEKINNDIVAYKLVGDKLKDYMSESKYSTRVKTSENGVVEPVKEEEFTKEEVTQIKNKICEKIRKQFDDYQKFDFNYIFAEIVYSGYKEFTSYDELNDEISYYVSHLEPNFGNIDFHLILKNGNKYIDFDLKTKKYVVL